MSMSALNGKTAVVTGSTSGIGLGVAGRLAAAGANVVLNGFGDPHAIEELRRQLAEQHRVDVRYGDADLVDPTQIRRLFALATEAFGHVDILVNNAGIQHVAPIVSFPDEQWDRVLAVNLSAVFRCTREALPGMLARNWGRIINIASAHGLVASVNKAAYVSSKHGVVGLTKVAALETAETGITVNAIAPGWVLTPLVDAQIRARAEAEGKSFEQARYELLAEKQPSRQFVTPEQIGDLVVFLCSPAADQIRGQAIGIDGGWTAQ
jgi:3-hydroxybutyrate dehydrogenase